MFAIIYMRGQDLTFFLVATFIFGFVCGVFWYWIGKRNKKAEADSEKRYANIIDLNEALDSTQYEWRKAEHN